MSTGRVVAWLTEDGWEACLAAAVGQAGRTDDLVLLHVIDTQVEEAAHGAFGGLLGRGSRQRDPGEAMHRMAERSSADLLAAALRRASRPARTQTRGGRVEREVVAACEGASLLVCARDGDQRRLGPRSLGPHTRFVVDHAPCGVLLIWPGEVPDLGSIPPPAPGEHPRHPPPAAPGEFPSPSPPAESPPPASPPPSTPPPPPAR
jgi:nucleotide-binding universal stress UspA family protein